MRLFPAIDIFDGRCVRLLYGEFDKITEYGEPIEMAKKWVSQGAKHLHIVDLNGSKNGVQSNLKAILGIAQSIGIPVQTGGGIRTMADIEDRLNNGISRVILGTVLYDNPTLASRAIEKYANRIVCGIDVKNGQVAIKGWTQTSDATAAALALKYKSLGADTVVYTDISRDGALSGVNIDACEKMQVETGMNIIASGGLSSLSEIIELNKRNVYGAILGKAIYSGKFDVRQAAECLK